jgi:hypothetical protein
MAPLSGQTNDSADSAKSQPTDCGAFTLQTVTTLSAKQRACYFGKPLITPQFALAAGFAAAFDQLRNSPHVRNQDFDEISRRLEILYARRAARNTAEFLVGYLHKEDPRFRKSLAHSFWRRTDSAFLNVVTSPDEDGHLRMAYAPIAGSLSSAFVGSVMYRHNETLPNTLTHAAAVYGYYFVRNFFEEFKPDIDSYVRHVFHRDQ